MGKWSELHGDMLTLVAECLTQTDDHITFSAVCSSWRLVALDIRSSLPISVPLLMLPGDTHPNLQTRMNLSLSNQRIYEKRSHFPHNDVCVGSHAGWLVIIHKNLEVSLFNPFSEDRLSLPSLTSIPKIEKSVMVVENDIFVEAAALSSSDMRTSPKDLTVMISYGVNRMLAFAKPGDLSWQAIFDQKNYRYCHFTRILFYKEKFYAIGERGTVECDIGPNPKIKLVAPKLGAYLNPGMLWCYKWYLVESLGELMVVARWIHLFDENIDDEVDNDGSLTIDFGFMGMVRFSKEKLGDHLKQYRTVFFTAYKLDFEKNEWTQVKDLSDQTFFVGHNTSFSLSNLNYKEIKGNCIYFTEDYMEGEISARLYDGSCYGYDMGVFDFFDGSIRPFFSADSNAYYPIPNWVIHRPW